MKDKHNTFLWKFLLPVVILNLSKNEKQKKKKNEEEERNMIWHTLFYIICYIYIFFDELGKYLLKSTV